MLKTLLIAALLAMSGCGDDETAAAAARKVHTEKRQAKAEAALAKTPVPRTYVMQGNQLQVVEVPVADQHGFVESKRCVVYRDLEFKQVAISCEQQPDILVSGAQ